MILLVLIASVLIAGVTIYQYREQSKDYHQNRLERKEEQILQSIGYALRETTYEPTTENLEHIFRDEIYKIADVQNVSFNIYDLEGELIKSTKPAFEADSVSNCLDAEVLNRLYESADRRYVEEKSTAGFNYQASYNYINDPKFKPIGIMNLPYYEDNSFNNMELREFLIRLGWVYLVMLLLPLYWPILFQNTLPVHWKPFQTNCIKRILPSAMKKSFWRIRPMRLVNWSVHITR